MAPHVKTFQKLLDLMELELPPGFPVMMELHFYHLLTARATILDFKWMNGSGFKFSLLNYTRVVIGNYSTRWQFWSCIIRIINGENLS